LAGTRSPSATFGSGYFGLYERGIGKHLRGQVLFHLVLFEGIGNYLGKVEQFLCFLVHRQFLVFI